MSSFLYKKIFDEQLKSFFRQKERDYFWKCIYQDLIEPQEVFVDEGKILQIINQLKGDMPIEYITGYCFFYDIKLKVTPEVLIPRPETEELVDIIINDHRKHFEKSLRVLDIGTGSGCIALCLKKHLPNISITAVDISKGALDLARQNASQLNLDIDFRLLDILSRDQQVALGSFDIIVSNPPYIVPSERMDIATATLSYEPDQALYAPELNPIIFYDRIAQFATNQLYSDGKIYVEINPRFTNETSACFDVFSDVEIINDLQQKQRMLRVKR